jgi:hypothetical protein
VPREDPRRRPGRHHAARPPAAARQQWFTLRPWQFDVTAATWLLRATPRPAQRLPVEPWARAYGLLPAPGDPNVISLIGPGPGFDPQYAMTTDLDEPVILATITRPGTEPAGESVPGPDSELVTVLLIDGCHRLYKAARLSREYLPALVLTAEETLAIRLDAVLGPPRTPARQRDGQTGGQP